MKDLADARVLITGAGSGLGRACALAFAARGARVMATDRRAEAALETRELLVARGATAVDGELDVSREEHFAVAVEQMQARWGGVDVLVNNAGVATAGTVADSPISQWQWVLDINLLGCVRGARAVIPLMQGQGRGHIVNVASFAGIASPPAVASYNAAKAAVISLSETLRYELYPQIGVSVVCPSFFKTDLLATSTQQRDDLVQARAPQVVGIMARQMDRSEVTAEDVARDLVEAVQQDRFLVMSHPEARALARLKRLSPELYFRRTRKANAAFLARPPD